MGRLTFTPNRFSRLIFNATKDAQERRWDLGYILGELERLAESERKPATVQSAEMVAEELAARGLNSEYEWDDAQRCARYRVGNIDISVAADEKARLVRLDFTWARVAGEDHQRTKSWLPERQRRIEDRLTASGWSSSITIDTGRLFGSATIEVREAVRRLDSCGQAIAFIKEQLVY